MRTTAEKWLAELAIAGLAFFCLGLLLNLTAAGASAAASSTATIVTSADSYVDQLHSRTNYGSAALKTDASPVMRSYLRFSISGLTSPVSKATLKVYATSSSRAGFEVHSVSNNNWSEFGITYQNAPRVSSTVTATSGPVTAGTWVSVDVTALVQGNGTRSIALVGRDKSILTLASREAGATAPQLVISMAALPQSSLLWSGDAETGNLSQWYLPDVAGGPNTGGGIYDSGIASSAISTDVARSGQYSVKMTVTTPSDPTSGTRLFRWLESRTYPEAYYSAWLYFPQNFKPSTYWNIVQFKSKTATLNDPFWILNVGNRSGSGNMYLYLYYWQSGTGPTVNETGPVSYDQSLKDLPVGQWVHIEVYLKEASDFSGRITVWQDGATIFDKNGVRTKYSDGDNQWSVNNYSSGLTPSTAAIYLDDAAINTSYIP